MSFDELFDDVFGPVLGGEAVVAVPSWWLTTGVVSGDCVGAWNGKGASSYADSLLNRNSPGVNDLTSSVSPSWSSAGWVGTGTQYLSTGVVPTANHTYIVKFLDYVLIPAHYGVIVGGRTSGINGMFIEPDGGAGVSYCGGGASLNKLPILAAGVLAISAGTAYRNGVSEGTCGNSPTTAYTIDLFRLNQASPTLYAKCTITSYAHYNKGLTLAQIQAIGTAMP